MDIILYGFVGSAFYHNHLTYIRKNERVAASEPSSS